MLNDEVKACIKRWLSDNLPEWVNFRIKIAAKYLGYFLGFTASEKQSQLADHEWLGRSLAIARANISAMATAVA